MKAHTVKSNAKRAARKLAEKCPGLFADEPIAAPDGGWYALVAGELEAARSVPVEAWEDIVFMAPDGRLGAPVPPVTPAPERPKPFDLPRPPAPSAEDDPKETEGDAFAEDRDALAALKVGDRVTFMQPGTFKVGDETREGREVVGVIAKVLHKDLGTASVVEDSGAEWCVRASRLRPAGPAPKPFGPHNPHPSPATEENVALALAGVADAVETRLDTGKIRLTPKEAKDAKKAHAVAAALPPRVASTPEEIEARREERRQRMAAEKAAGLRDATGTKAKAKTPRATSRAPRGDTKAALIVRLVSREEGATMDELMSATGWLRHTLRGYIGGTLRKRGHLFRMVRGKGGLPTRHFNAPESTETEDDDA